MTGPDVTVDALILMYAFRYALGRRTSAPVDVAATIRQHIDVLPLDLCHQIVREIDDAIGRGAAGAPCDVDEWTALARNIRAAREVE